MDEFRCEVCGKVLANKHGLGCHRGRAHGPKSARKGVPQPGRASRKRPAAVVPSNSESVLTPESIDAAFAQAQAALSLERQVMDRCLDGLRELLGGVKDLRAAFIARSEELRKLRVEIAELGPVPDADQEEKA